MKSFQTVKGCRLVAQSRPGLWFGQQRFFRPGKSDSETFRTPSFRTPTETENLKDLEVKDPQVIFDSVWEDLESKFTLHKMSFPKEIIFLGGAPGAGKGTNTPFISKARGITSPPIVMSDKLNTPEFRRIKDRGEMISDAAAMKVMLTSLLEEQFRVGALVDGFPRTKTQVQLTKLFHQKCLELRSHFRDTPYADNFQRPSFKMCVLFVTEEESLQRQLRRGEEIKAHNQKVTETGDGVLLPVRATDLDPALVKQRYQIFKEHYSTLKELQAIFPFHVINASGPIKEVQKRILEQMQYQSSLELSQQAWDCIHLLPLPDELTKHARQSLVQRIEGYVSKHHGLFKQVVSTVEMEFVPVLKRHSLTGAACVRTAVPVFEDPMAINMAMDLMAERGYTIMHVTEESHIPTYVDTDGRITCSTKKVNVFQITFPRPVLRRTVDT